MDGVGWLLDQSPSFAIGDIGKTSNVQSAFSHGVYSTCFLLGLWIDQTIFTSFAKDDDWLNTYFLCSVTHKLKPRLHVPTIADTLKKEKNYKLYNLSKGNNVHGTWSIQAALFK